MARCFGDAGLDTPALDARRLALGILALDALALVRDPDRPLVRRDRARLAEASRRRLAREPVSRILGHRAFHGLDLEIAPATLDPRPDTETLVDAVLELSTAASPVADGAPRILDLGTGSGAILLALLVSLPRATGVGVDISTDALAVAARNAARLGLERRATFERSNWFSAVPGSFDLVVANPPYIPSRDIMSLDPEVARYDPIAALDGGADGLDAYRAISAGLRGALQPNGWVVVEVGSGQSEAVAGILRRAFPEHATVETRVWPDLAGRLRCVAVRARA